MSRLLRLAVCQYEPGQDLAANRTACRATLEEAARAGAQLALLPELSLLPYFCAVQDPRHFDLAETIPGPGTDFLAEAAKSLGLVIVGTLFERRAAGLYHNTAVVLERDGSLAGCYRKLHVPQEPGYEEKYYFTPGSAGCTPIDTSCGRLGVLVCWDQWFPEAARLQTLAEAELLLYPSAIGWDPDEQEAERNRQLEAWITVQRGHAIANCLPLAAGNRIGRQARPGGSCLFWGSSFISGPQGELLARASETREAVILAELEPGRSEQLRRTWPFLRDRRVDAYQDLVLRDTVHDPG